MLSTIWCVQKWILGWKVTRWRVTPSFNIWHYLAAGLLYVVQAKWQMTYVGFLLILNRFLSCPFTLSRRRLLPLLNNKKKKTLHGVIRCKQVLVYPLKERKEALWMFCLYNQHISTPGYPRDSYIISCNALKLLSPALTRCAAFLTVAPVLGVSACMHASLVAPCPSVSHRVRMWVLVIYNPCLCFVENVQTDIDAL